MRVRVTASNKHPGWLLYAALLFGAVMLPYFFIGKRAADLASCPATQAGRARAL